MTTEILACDIDLHKVYIMSGHGEVIANGAKTMTAAFATSKHGGLPPSEKLTILCEIASPVSAARAKVSSNAIGYNLMKWAIFNVSQIGVLATALRGEDYIEVLVAPSDKWTKGYDVKTRHKLAKCTAKNKDLRECEAMIWFYKQDPTVWVPLPKYLENL